MKILVTGAGGFLGRHLCRALQGKGHKVVNFSRSAYPDLKEQGIETIRGDISDGATVEAAMQGIDAVFHVASKVGIWGKYDDYFRTNVMGTQNIIDGCKKQGIKKLIYTSSPSVVFGKESLCGVDEKQSYPAEYISHYAETKGLAEQRILAANDENLATVALRPHLIFGPGDHHIFPRIVERARTGKLKRIGNGNNMVDVIYVKNAVDAHISAFEKLEPGSAIAGKAYFLGQENPVNLWDFIDDILVRHKVEPLTDKISDKAAYKIGWLMEKGYGLLGIKSEPPMTRFMALQLSCSHYFNHKNAEKDLGYVPRVHIKEALDETVRI